MDIILKNELISGFLRQSDITNKKLYSVIIVLIGNLYYNDKYFLNELKNIIPTWYDNDLAIYREYERDSRNEMIKIYNVIKKYNSLVIYQLCFYLNSLEIRFGYQFIIKIAYENTHKGIMIYSCTQYSYREKDGFPRNIKFENSK